MQKLYLFLFFAFLSTFGRAQSNEGTRFHLAFLEHIDIGRNNMVVMITSKFNTSGTVEMPLLGWKQSFSVTANQVTIVTLPKTAETIGSEMVSSNGISISSEKNISVYMHQYYNQRSEASIVLPDDALGTEYYAIAYKTYQRSGIVYPSECVIVGVKEDTEIEITLSDRTKGGRNKGDKINIILGPGQTYQIQTQLANSEITGTSIKGNKPFALFAGNTWTPMPDPCEARDNLLEQMYPISTWGKEFISVLSAQVTFDVFRILASEDETTVNIQGSTKDTYKLNKGQFIEYQKGESTYISSNKPIAVAQYNVGGQCGGNPSRLGDPSMVLLNSIEQIRDTVTLYNSNFQQITENYLNVVALSTDISKVTLDGTPLGNIPGVIGTVAGNTKYSFARIKVNAGSHTLISNGCGMSVTAYGYGNAESYAYNGGASFKPINASPLPEGGCLNDSILFDIGLAAPRFSLFWDFGNKDTSRLNVLKRSYNQVGPQYVKLVINDQCLKKLDTINGFLNITIPDTLSVPDALIACEKDTLKLRVNDNLSEWYQWNGPNGFVSIEKNPLISNINKTMSGNYSVIGFLDGCNTQPALTKVSVKVNPKPSLGADAFICPDEPTFSLRLQGGFFSKYQWQDKSTLPYFDVDEESTYTVRVWDEWGCTGTDSIVLSRKCPTKVYAPTAFSPNKDGFNDQFLLYGKDIISFDLTIADRWGNIVFKSNDIEMGWNGQFKGVDSDPGVYVWMATLEGYRRNGKTFIETKSGTVALIR
ncbi:MAG: gliding motility-associated C-terminal domain-containing protein [Saprospiraceae bacterium]